MSRGIVVRVLITIFEKLVPISGGGTPRTSSLVKAFVARGHEVHVASSIAVTRREAISRLGCDDWVPLQGVNRLGRWKMPKYMVAFPYNILRVAAAVRRLKPDLIVSHNSIAGYGALLGQKWSPRSLTVLDLTDLLFEYLEDYSQAGWLRAVSSGGRRLENKVIRESDRIVTISDAMKGIAADLGADVGHIDVVPDGVDTGLFQPVDGQPLRDAHARGASHVLIFHGAIDPQDDPGLLVDAARLVVASHADVCFWLVGNGSAVPDLKKKVSRYSLDDNFYFSGWVEQQQIPSFISASDIGLVVLPDVISARGRVTLKEFEYWACGVPAILPRLPALQEVAQEGVTALFYRPGDANDLADQIGRLMDDPALRARLGGNGLAMVKEKYEWSRLADRFVELCEGYVHDARSDEEG
jgi:glycosyltransferase involved in cell wall biosynthesis